MSGQEKETGRCKVTAHNLNSANLLVVLLLSDSFVILGWANLGSNLKNHYTCVLVVLCYHGTCTSHQLATGGNTLPATENLLVPARMVNEYVYCPRLAYLEWVQGEWESTADTVEGKQIHQRIDSKENSLPQSSKDDGGFHI